MDEPIALTQFFRQHGGLSEAEFHERFDGAFLLMRLGKTPPLVLFVPRDPERKVTIGSDEDCVLESFTDPTLDAQHAVVSYHRGFRGWTVEDQGSEFGTHVDGDRVSAGRPILLQDRAVVKPGGGLTEVQFYLAETLYQRIKKAGVTASLRRLQKRKQPPARPEKPPPASPPAEAPADEPENSMLLPEGESSDDDPPTTKLKRPKTDE
jgi:hypothetical protein